MTGAGNTNVSVGGCIRTMVEGRMLLVGVDHVVYHVVAVVVAELEAVVVGRRVRWCVCMVLLLLVLMMM